MESLEGMLSVWEDRRMIDDVPDSELPGNESMKDLVDEQQMRRGRESKQVRRLRTKKIALFFF